MPESALGRRHVTPAILSDPRHRRARAVRRRAESFGRLPHRRHRLQRHRHAGDAVRRRARRSAARPAGHALRRERARRADRHARARSGETSSCCRRKRASASTAASLSARSRPDRSSAELGLACRRAALSQRRFSPRYVPRSRRHQRSRRAHCAREVAMAAGRRRRASTSPGCMPRSTTATTPGRSTTRATRSPTIPARTRSAPMECHCVRRRPRVASADLTVIAALANSDMEHSYDGDWGNPQSWAAVHIRLLLSRRCGSARRAASRCASLRPRLAAPESLALAGRRIRAAISASECDEISTVSMSSRVSRTIQ